MNAVCAVIAILFTTSYTFVLQCMHGELKVVSKNYFVYQLWHNAYHDSCQLNSIFVQLIIKIFLGMAVVLKLFKAIPTGSYVARTQPTVFLYDLEK